MEEKNVFFSKEFGDVNAVPVCLDTLGQKRSLQLSKILLLHSAESILRTSPLRAVLNWRRLKAMLDIGIPWWPACFSQSSTLSHLPRSSTVCRVSLARKRRLKRSLSTAPVLWALPIINYSSLRFPNMYYVRPQGIIGKIANLNWMQKNDRK